MDVLEDEREVFSREKKNSVIIQCRLSARLAEIIPTGRNTDDRD